MTGIYRGFCYRERDTGRETEGGGRKRRRNARSGRERDGPTSSVFTVLGGCDNSVGETTRRGGWGRESKGQGKGVHGDAEKREG